jgi:hypothetical protein
LIEDWNRLIIIHYFEEEVVVDDASVGGAAAKTGMSIGIVFTTKRLLIEHFKPCYDAQNREGLVVSLDGTWRLVVGDRPLLVFGADYLCEESQSHSFVPWCFCWSKSENLFATDALISKFVLACNLFIFKDTDEPINVKVGIIDHSAALRAALVKNFPHIYIVSCWAHLSRNARTVAGQSYDDESSGLKLKIPYVVGGKNFFDEEIMPYLRRMHLSQTESEFDSFTDALRAKFGTICPRFIDRFTEENCSPDWKGWYIGFLPIKGVGLTSNPIESYNRQLKRIVDLRSIYNACLLLIYVYAFCLRSYYSSYCS